VVSEGHLGFAHVVAGVVNRDGVMVAGGIQFDASLLDILLEEFLDA